MTDDWSIFMFVWILGLQFLLFIYFVVYIEPVAASVNYQNIIYIYIYIYPQLPSQPLKLTIEDSRSYDREVDNIRIRIRNRNRDRKF